MRILLSARFYISHPPRIIKQCLKFSPKHLNRNYIRPFGQCTTLQSQSQPIAFNMTDTNPPESAREEIERLAEPAEKEAEILCKNEKREEALKESAKEETPKEEKKEEPLPKLSAADFQVYNSMADHMEYFHNHFRQAWTLLHTATRNNTRPKNLSLRQFLQTGLQFCSHLHTHHSIEEQHIFPVLAKKMPEFRNTAELLRQHKEIHAGMDAFQEYLEQCRSGETELSLKVLGEKMDTWGEVLWTHLDQEVKTLGAENMRKYWTKEEMRRMPM